jgi:hypothetical protein
MKLDDFRRIALSLPRTVATNGLGYTSFRAKGKSFAAIDDSVPVIRLTRDQQKAVMAVAPDTFSPEPGGWGLMGSTVVRLEAAQEAAVREVLAAAWRNIIERDPADVHLTNIT